MARFYVRAALGYHDLGDYAVNVEMVTSELVSNAIAHTSARTINLELIRIHADYSPQYVKLARITRDKIESGEYERLAAIPATGLAGAYGVSIRVAYAALAILGANRYVGRVRGLKSYRVTWDARYGQTRARG
jgi:hypothetical protein